ncbi:hypothetical protein PRUPE_1G097800 [Prunus persica]|uniref:Uncharacterized protein n=1 Tax=Prunus persica TaxID=3760 RepID=M5Y1I8_PRUPE|nr:hypothetical protein PRUPE_1G097800 [Prunus persica]
MATDSFAMSMLPLGVGWEHKGRLNLRGCSKIGALQNRKSCAMGFSVNLGYGSVIEVELWGIFWGLSMAWDADFRTVEIECDSTSAVALLKSPIDWCCYVKHIFREQNCAADALTVKCYDFDPGLHVFLEAPAFLSDVLAANVRGAVRPRLVSV